VNATTEPERDPWLPPRWIIHLAWIAHRAAYRFTGGRRGLSLPTAEGKFGQMSLRTIGRKSGKERVAILGYYEDGPNLVTMAMNGWGAPEPAWWLNLQAHPEADVELAGGIRQPVLGRAAVGEERERLWRRWAEIDRNLEGYASRRPHETAVVILEPRSPGGGGS
jgi:deazaflavin-dependent oxidoreductase (nitroreductase family)